MDLSLEKNLKDLGKSECSEDESEDSANEEDEDGLQLGIR